MSTVIPDLFGGDNFCFPVFFAEILPPRKTPNKLPPPANLFGVICESHPWKIYGVDGCVGGQGVSCFFIFGSLDVNGSLFFHLTPELCPNLIESYLKLYGAVFGVFLRIESSRCPLSNGAKIVENGAIHLEI